VYDKGDKDELAVNVNTGTAQLMEFTGLALIDEIKAVVMGQLAKSLGEGNDAAVELKLIAEPEIKPT
jgi:hypothetical protein